MPSEVKSSQEATIEPLPCIQAMGGSCPRRLMVHRMNPGRLRGQQTAEVRGIHAGVDWQAGRAIVERAKPLTELRLGQIEAIRQSARQGARWHAYQREKKLRGRTDELEAKLAWLRAGESDGRAAAQERA